MKTPAYEEAVSYLKLCAIGVFFTFCYNALGGALRALGNSKVPMYCIFVSTVVNIVLDIVFMGVYDFGTKGAAAATVIAQGISCVMMMVYVLRQGEIWTGFSIKQKVLWRIVKLGFPCAVQMTVAGISFLVVTYTINGYGVAASAGTSISHISGSFKQSVDVIPMGKKLKPSTVIYMYRDMLVYNLMRNMDYDQLYGIYSSTVKTLDEYDKENNTEFLTTLETYISHFKNISKSADALFLHRNTMLYRIDKIKDILMMDFDDAESVLNLQMGIHAKKVIDAFFK